MRLDLLRTQYSYWNQQTSICGFVSVCQQIGFETLAGQNDPDSRSIMHIFFIIFFFFWCVWLFKHISAQSLGASCIKQSPELNVCLLRDGSVTLLGGFKGVSLQAGWVRVLGRSGTQTHTLKCARATHAHRPILAVVSIGRGTEPLFVSQRSPLMCGSIFHAAVPLLFPLFSPSRSKRGQRASFGRHPTYLMCSARVVLPDSSWTEPVPNQGPARMQHQTLSPGAQFWRVCVHVWVSAGVCVCVRRISKREILKNMLVKS